MSSHTSICFDAEHMKLYGKKFNNPQLQDCFYTLYNAEIECVSGVFSQLKNKHKHHKKGMDKYARNYLLDTLELNTKSRCVFAWSGQCTPTSSLFNHNTISLEFLDGFF